MLLLNSVFEIKKTLICKIMAVYRALSVADEGKFVSSPANAYVNQPYIFLPAAGQMIGNEVLNYGKAGYYWSSSREDDDRSPYMNCCAHHMFFGDAYDFGGERSYGKSIRPVFKK